MLAALNDHALWFLQARHAQQPFFEFLEAFILHINFGFLDLGLLKVIEIIELSIFWVLELPSFELLELKLCFQFLNLVRIWLLIVYDLSIFDSCLIDLDVFRILVSFMNLRFRRLGWVCRILC